MNTSAFVTAIQRKLIEGKLKTFFFLFAFCLLIAAFSIEKIMGNVLSERLEQERKKDFREGIKSAFEQRWKLHNGHIRSYAYWTEIWDLINAKKLETVYLNFQSDTSIDKQFDFFAIYLNPEKQFITKWSDGSGRKLSPDSKIISYLYDLQSKKEGQSNHIIFFNQQYYLVSTSPLADNSGYPMIEGIMLFGFELDNFIVNTEDLFHIQMERADDSEVPLNYYDSFSLAEFSLPNSEKISLVYQPDSVRAQLIRPYIIGILGIFFVVSLSLFCWILYRLKNPSID